MKKPNKVESLSKHEALIYAIFRNNPYKGLSVQDIWTILERDFQTLSIRTIYRMVENLQKKKVVFCMDIREGIRLFSLTNKYHVQLCCSKCGWIEDIDLQQSKVFYQLYDTIGDPSMIGGRMILSGVCKQCT
ncbi:Fe2+ or Zn2+ uptake regulation protein [Anaerosolibacter carboniphilus]|uniref:Fe2+ or Zn2+ uptake regulation protein n=1 Tax=Anaerosolibacter carboniphilus TaxID=1417629 RepID=A0A841KXS0_9FIRM|nr:transcriptional repressor [Anaerosolibacter carboniphilus]MBB6216790.1 Fe2+ or Zn2+ uptake regulation protein [Anaerosolibacter carboniphilus]